MSFVTLSGVAAVVLLVGVCLYPWMGMRDTKPLHRLTSTLFPASQLLCILTAFATVYYLGIDDVYILAFSFIALMCAVCDVPLLHALHVASYKEQEAARVKLVETQLETQKRHLVAIRLEQEEAGRMRQSFNEQLAKLEGALETGDEDAINACLDAAALAVDSSAEHFCEHPALDALLASKAALCRKFSITLTVNAQVPRTVSIRDAELCAVVGNAMDNAAKACRELPENERWIRLKLVPAHGFLALDVTNSCLPEDTMHPSSESPDTEALVPEHGWGLKIITSIIARHDGELEYGAENGTYRLSALMQL